jgi:hypothetical protein
MNDTTSIKAFQIIGKNNTITYSIDKETVNHLAKEKPSDSSHYIDILIPIAVALLTMALTKLFDMWMENRKYKREILNENRKSKINFIRYLNSMRTSFEKSHSPDADYEDFLTRIANKMVSNNPFEDLKNSANIIFNDNKELIRLIDELFSNAESINNNFDWKNGHPSKNLDYAKDIYEKLGDVIKKISNDIN